MDANEGTRASGGRIAAGALAAWAVFLAFDFLLHAVIFAGWWQATQRYWLPPEDLFRLIPYAYVSFAVYCAALIWLYERLYGDRRTFGAACRFGASAGLVFGISAVLANYSVFRLPASALLVWPASFLIESTAACAAAGSVLGSRRPWRRVVLVFAAAVLLLIVGIVLQNIL